MVEPAPLLALGPDMLAHVLSYCVNRFEDRVTLSTVNRAFCVAVQRVERDWTNDWNTMVYHAKRHYERDQFANDDVVDMTIMESATLCVKSNHTLKQCPHLYAVRKNAIGLALMYMDAAVLIDNLDLPINTVMGQVVDEAGLTGMLHVIQHKDFTELIDTNTDFGVLYTFALMAEGAWRRVLNDDEEEYDDPLDMPWTYWDVDHVQEYFPSEWLEHLMPLSKWWNPCVKIYDNYLKSHWYSAELYDAIGRGIMEAQHFSRFSAPPASQ